MTFLNPGLLAGALLFTVPLIIHLLNRQRHKRRPWAAMEFLLAAYQKTRNRLRNENLLLLLLRCLIPILLALAIARPVLQSAAAALGFGGSTHHFVVLDQSYSMGFTGNGAQSPFDRGRALVGRLLDQLAAATDRNDKVTLVLASVRPHFLVRAETNLAVARARWLEAQKPEDGAADLRAALAQTAAAVEESGDHQVQVYVLTDLQTRAFGELPPGAGAAAPPAGQTPPPTAATPPEAAAGPEFHDTARDLIERLQKRDGTRVHVLDVGPFADQRGGGLCDNVQVTGLRFDQAVAIARVPLTVIATLHNRGAASASVQVTLEIDGSEPTRKQVALEAAAEGEAEFQIVLRELGRHRLRVSLTQDGLEADDEWNQSLEVRDRVRILVVDGAADDDPLRCYGTYYRDFLDPPGWQGPPDVPQFEVTTCDTLALLSGQQSPANFDVTVLADVDRVNERAAQELDKALLAGRGLLVTFGQQCDPESFNLHLYAAGEGPMPFRLGAPSGSPFGDGVARQPVFSKPDHPVLAEFDEQVYREIAQAIPVYQWLATVKDSFRDGADVVLSLNDPQQSPLLVTAAHGPGKVAFLTSAPAPKDRKERWNRFDDPMIAFHLLHGLCKWLALPTQDPFNVAVGTALTCSLPSRPGDVEVLVPERQGGGKHLVSDEPRALPGGRYALPAYANTVTAGFYVCELMLERDTGKEPQSLTFAVHVDPEEGLLRYSSHDEVVQALAIERVLTALPNTSSRPQDAGNNEYGPWLLLLTLLVVVGEAAVARYVSVRRS